MNDLQTFYDWMKDSAGKTESTSRHYKSGLSACSKDFLVWNITEKPLTEMTLSELDVAIQKAFLCSQFVEKNKIGNAMYSNSLKQFRNFLAVHDALLFDNSYEQFIENKNELSATERSSIVRSRVGQGLFRERLLTKYGGRCIVTGANDKRLLLASHIRPWSVSTNEQRLSSENGLLLSPLYDKLFDVGLITFDDNGRIIVSKELKNPNVDMLQIDCTQQHDLKRSTVFDKNMEYHRSFVFLGGI